MEDFNPQQQKFLELFLNPDVDTFGNYRQSALQAGYSEDYADNISVQMPNWLNEALGKSRRLIKAEKNLDMALDGMLDDPEGGKRDIQWKATEFIAKTHKKSLYSERTETDFTSGGEKIATIINIVKPDASS